MSPRAFVSAALSLGLVLALSGCGSGGGGSGPAGSSPALGIVEGYILDEAGNPVEGARVSVNGIEADALTGPDGFYRVRDESLGASSGMVLAGASASGPAEVEIAVLAPGVEPRVASLEVTEGDLASDVAPLDNEKRAPRECSGRRSRMRPECSPENGASAWS